MQNEAPTGLYQYRIIERSNKIGKKFYYVEESREAPGGCLTLGIINYKWQARLDTKTWDLEKAKESKKQLENNTYFIVRRVE